MVDLHTHILPGMDDGAQTPEDSLALLQEEKRQGVHRLALTPHFYRHRESLSDFLTRREAAAQKLKAAIAALPEAEQEQLPEWKLAAEVAWMPGLSGCSGLEQLCYAGTRSILIEPPMAPWDRRMFDELYDFMSHTGLTPVIAHIDRYWQCQSKDAISELLSLGLPVQLSSEALLHFSHRRRALEYLKQGYAQLLMSDCHSLHRRPPNLAEGMRVAEKKLGAELLSALRQQCSDIYDGV